MSNKKIIELSPGIWITEEDWDNCKKFEEDQQKKLAEFMWKQVYNIEDSNATAEID